MLFMHYAGVRLYFPPSTDGNPTSYRSSSDATGTSTRSAEFLDVGDVVICTDGPAHLDVLEEKETDIEVPLIRL